MCVCVCVCVCGGARGEKKGGEVAGNVDKKETRGIEVGSRALGVKGGG